MEDTEYKPSDEALNYSNMNEALNAIHNEAMRLAGLCAADTEVRRGLDLIISLSRYKFNVTNKGKIESD